MPHTALGLLQVTAFYLWVMLKKQDVVVLHGFVQEGFFSSRVVNGNMS